MSTSLPRSRAGLISGYPRGPGSVTALRLYSAAAASAGLMLGGKAFTGFEEVEEEAGGDGERAPPVPDGEHLADQGQARDLQGVQLAGVQLLRHRMGGQD